MDDKFFWNWLESCRNKVINPTAADFEAQFLLLGKVHREEMANCFLDKIHALDTPLVWCAGSIINGRVLGDDLFLYFRRWIVWGGASFYDLMLDSPDEIVDQKVDISCIFNEEIIGGLLKFSSPANQRGVWYDNWSWGDWDESRMEKALPRLWGIFGDSFNGDVVSFNTGVTEINVPGLGLVKIGAKVRNRFGKGVGFVKEILYDQSYAVLIKYESGIEERDTLIPFLFEIVS